MNGDESCRPDRSDPAEAPRSTTNSNGNGSRQCPDCAATLTQNGFLHHTTCPLWLAVLVTSDQDVAWFRDNPRAIDRLRAASLAEKQELELSLGWRPTRPVRVTKGKPGFLYRHYRGATESAILLEHVGGAR